MRQLYRQAYALNTCALQGVHDLDHVFVFDGTVEEWSARPGRPDNHWLDCLVGCAVGASMQGAALAGGGSFRTVKKPRVSFSELQRKRRAGG